MNKHVKHQPKVPLSNFNMNIMPSHVNRSLDHVLAHPDGDGLLCIYVMKWGTLSFVAFPFTERGTASENQFGSPSSKHRLVLYLSKKIMAPFS